MRIFSIVIAALLCASGFYHAFALPTTNSSVLEPRSKIGDTKSNPIRAEIEIRGEDSLTYDVDCWDMLCKGKPTVMQKVNQNTARKHRQIKTGSGAKNQPFANRVKYGIKASPATSAWAAHRKWSSAEEFPFASTADGGKNAILVGVTENSQEEQKTSLRTFYHSNRIWAYNETTNSSERSWFEITGFKTRAGTTAKIGPYCKAFNARDSKVCSASTKVVGAWGFDVAEYAYVYNHQKKKFEYVGK
ncbi:hypothetical protein AtubIFM55763_004860 [Aspergillus tubingensis]|uniref:Deoxyribonuclease NucA/NucB domain-containing protein n=2 Tax=Aspergillus subgen. Circumdati TaxID=2720871 RepID=A0A100IQZ2_ASPNG|nr:glycosyl transferase 41 family protein [Aspergillus tubingensis]GAQ45747.1 hypothetical protein ASPNIDRAFT_36122 [Aspergillus niger]GFN11726.1 glycosyl transferase 41 family protein [Aspergillus tubingensis]GLA66811.1 hypothetical protein AtubIFM54640_009397 [Aspergillus tubingensis]GLA73925.1 hypothetical protein AtubIFM55763_004860 [Aspergillus tubingensis]GLA85042.1 hypothetical protein AtubIFM56815_009266 [Aspergillus tubingensis]